MKRVLFGLMALAFISVSAFAATVKLKDCCGADKCASVVCETHKADCCK